MDEIKEKKQKSESECSYNLNGREMDINRFAETTNAFVCTAEDPAEVMEKILSGELKSPSPDYVKSVIRAMSGGNSVYETDQPDASAVRESLAYKVKRKYTIEDYYRLPDDVRVELMDGEFFVMEAPSFVHQRIIARLAFQIESFIQKMKGKCIATVAPVDVRLDRDDYTMVQPDVMIICNHEQIDRRRLEGAPDFVCEVISPSTASKDYVKKAAKYEAAGVKEYWIIDPNRLTLTTYDFTDGGVPQIRELKGKAGVKIYQDELMIDLDEFAAIAERGF